MDFVQDFCEFVSSRCKRSEPLWIKIVAYGVLSTALGINRFINTIKGPMPLSVFGFHVGPSRLGNKSIVLDNFAVPIIDRFSDLIFFTLPDKELNRSVHLPDEFSSEKMTAILTDIPYGMIFADEFTSMLRGSRNKSWQVNLIEYLSRLHDGKIGKRATIKHGIQTAPNVCVNAAFTTTPVLFNVADRQIFFTQGLGNRMLYIYTNKIDSNIQTDYKSLFPDSVTSLGNELDKFAQRLVNFRAKVAHGAINIDDESKKLLSIYYDEHLAEASDLFNKNNADTTYSYISTLPSFVFKLSALNAYSKCEKGNFARITVDDVTNAINDVEKYYDHFERFINAWAMHSVKRVPTGNEWHLDQVLAVIKSSENGLSTQKGISNVLSKNYHEILPLLQLLEQKGEIESFEPTRDIWTKPGPLPNRVFRLVT